MTINKLDYVVQHLVCIKYSQL